MPATAVVAALAALGVDAAGPEAVRAALDARERELSERLLPPTVVRWTSTPGQPSGAPDQRSGAPGQRPGTPSQPPGPPAERADTPVEGRHAPAGQPGTPEERPGAPGQPSGAPGQPSGAPGQRSGTLGQPPGTPSQPPGPPAEPSAPSAPPDAPTVTPDQSGPPDPFAALPPGTRLHITTEQGDTRDAVDGLPPGVHRVTATAPDGRTADAHLIVAPERLPTPTTRSYGLLAQLYSVLSHRSWGMGDLGDLAELAGWAGRAAGAGFVQVNPLHAAVPGAGAPTDPSPYRPSSRRFPDPVHLRPEAIPEYAYADHHRLAALRERAERLRADVLDKGALIDRDAVWELKREALELVARVPLGPGRQTAYDAFRAEEGQALEDHATWYALAERHGPDWRSWPPALRDPRSEETARARAELAPRVEFHTRLAWLTDQQLRAAQRAAREAGMPVGIVHDLAVGVHPQGADAWAQQDHFAAGMSVGAPPDAFNARGQDWGLPPWRPDRLAVSGHAPYRRLLRALFRYAGAVRIDHVMGLFRLWWVPEGSPPTEGTYVRYDADAMLALLALEASRAGALVIGEDLGTVEPGVRETLRRHGVLGTSVLWFERDWEGDGRPLPPERWRSDCLATATTHDLPPTASRLTGEHVDLRDRLGLLTRPAADERAEAVADTAEWLALLGSLGLLDSPAAGPPGTDEAAEIEGFHRFLLRTPARMIGVWLPDGIGDRRPQNLPGTWDEYPNWRLPVSDAAGAPVALETLTASPRLRALLEVVRAGLAAPGR
ncbi:4-alpha-glucanotransferase [Streptomyces sp. NPDC005435]|uniref:4-alpha-glucanotransferase n=1 Tax=Streptomyces sp. NPDC005435 TaxID=3154464 RepID=UPI00387EC55F